MILSRNTIAIAACLFSVLLVGGCGRSSRSVPPVSAVNFQTAAPSTALPDWQGSFLSFEGRPELWAVDLATGEKRLLRRDVIAPTLVRSGKWVAWLHDQNPPSGPLQLFVLDLTTGTTRCLPAEVNVVGVAVDRGELCFLQEVSDTSSRVFVSDLARGTTTYVATSGAVVADPAIAANWLAWRDDRSQTTLVYDIETQKRLSLPCGEDAPLLSGHWLAWSVSSQTSGLQKVSSVRVRDLLTGRELAVTDFAVPSLNGGQIAALHAPWLVWNDRDRELKVLDLASGERQVLSARGSGIDAVLVSSDWIVWAAGVGTPGIFARNMRTHEILRLSDKRDINGPWLVGSWVVWSGIQGNVTSFHARNLVSGAVRDFSL